MQFRDRETSVSRAGGGEERVGSGGREYETVAMVHQSADSPSSHSGQQPQRTNLYPYTDDRTRRGDSDVSSDVLAPDPMLGQDHSIVSHSASSGSYHPQYPMQDHQASPGASSHSDRVTDRSSDSLTTASRQLDLSVTARRSPHSLDLMPRDRSGSRGHVYSGHRNGSAVTPQKSFEAYPNPYGEPLEDRDPLMLRYEDVAMFKVSQDPSSQVSSSTDSGYGHGHNIYERIGDLQMRRSGEQ